MRDYEITLLLDGRLSEQEMDPVLSKFEGIIVKMGGEMVARENTGRRRLAVKIGDKSEAHFFLLKCKCDNQILNELNRNLRLTEGVLRSMVIRV